MAKVTYSSAVTELRGNVGSLCYSRARGGALVRARLTRVAEWNELQLYIRWLRTLIYQAWHGDLTETQRQQWNSFAASHTEHDQLHQGKTLTGQNWFFRLSYWPGIWLETVLYTPPADLTTFTPPVISVDTATTAPTSLILDIDRALDEWEVLIIATTRALSPGISSPGHRFRIWVGSNYETEWPRDLSADWADQWPAPTAGQKTFLRYYSVSLYNGVRSVPQVFSFTWT